MFKPRVPAGEVDHRAELDRAVEARKRDFLEGCPKPCRKDIKKLHRLEELIRMRHVCTEYPPDMKQMCRDCHSSWPCVFIEALEDV